MNQTEGVRHSCPRRRWPRRTTDEQRSGRGFGCRCDATRARSEVSRAHLTAMSTRCMGVDARPGRGLGRAHWRRFVLPGRSVAQPAGARELHVAEQLPRRWYSLQQLALRRKLRHSPDAPLWAFCHVGRARRCAGWRHESAHPRILLRQLRPTERRDREARLSLGPHARLPGGTIHTSAKDAGAQGVHCAPAGRTDALPHPNLVERDGVIATLLVQPVRCFAPRLQHCPLEEQAAAHDGDAAEHRKEGREVEGEAGACALREEEDHAHCRQVAVADEQMQRLDPGVRRVVGDHPENPQDARPREARLAQPADDGGAARGAEPLRHVHRVDRLPVHHASDNGDGH
eukprot:6068257-Prymnesium_polylepis.3